jgi:hypothetical protein
VASVQAGGAIAGHFVVFMHVKSKAAFLANPIVGLLSQAQASVHRNLKFSVGHPQS